jgi:P27 family predicted phage terminase small subunit
MLKKSNESKALTGTLRKDRVKEYEGESIPEPIFGLTSEERKIYSRLKTHLENNSASAEIDCINLSIAARIISQMVDDAKQWKTKGSVMFYPNGTRQISAELTAFKTSYELFKSVATNLGLTPKSRSQMDYFINPNDNQEDPFACFLDN